MISKNAETSKGNIASLIKHQEENERKATRLVSALAINLADYETNLVAGKDAADRVSFDFALMNENLRKIVTAGAPRDMTNDGKADSKYVSKAMSSALDAVKIAIMLLTPEKTGFSAGFVKNEDSDDFVSAETYNGMTAGEKDRHSPEIFWNMAKTFPKRSEGKKATSDSPTNNLLPTRANMRDAYKRHFGDGELNEQKTGLKTGNRDNPTQPLLTEKTERKQVWQVLDNVKNWLETGSFMAFDMAESKGDKKAAGVTLGRLNDLATAIEKCISDNATALKDAEQQAQREADKKNTSPAAAPMSDAA
jgi:hypothetical protein